MYESARWYTPASGTFNRLDPFFGNLRDPQSLHKYLYVHGDPIQGLDPSGLFSTGKIAVAMTIGSIVANLAISGIGSFRVGHHFSGQTKVLPDGLVATVSAGAAVRGLTGGGSLNLYFDFRNLRLLYFFSMEGGIAPLSVFPKQTKLFAWGYGFGLVFNAKSAQDLSGGAWTAYWPINVMAGGGKQSFIQRVRARSGWRVDGDYYNYLMALARYVNERSGRQTTYKIAKKPGTLVISTSATLSFTDGAAVVGWQNRDINFGTTFSRSTVPRDVFADIAELPTYIQNSASQLQGMIPMLKQAMATPEGAADAFWQAMGVLTSGSSGT